MAARWRYFLTGRHPERAEEGTSTLLRLRDGAPLLTAEMASATGGWTQTDRMWREHFLGSDDWFTEVDVDRARHVVEAWVRIGLFRVPTDLDAPGPGEDAVTAARAADEQAEAVWRDVRTPPGAQELDLG